MKTTYKQSCDEKTDIKIVQRAYEFYLKEYSPVLSQDFAEHHPALLGKNKKALLDESKIQESRINVFKESIAHDNHFKLALGISKTINDENKYILNRIVKDAIISRLEEKNVDYIAVENLIKAFKIKREELQNDIIKTIKNDIDRQDTYANAIDLLLYFKQDLGNNAIRDISKKLLEKAADTCLETSLNQNGQKKNLDFLYETSTKLNLTHDEVAELLNAHVREKLKNHILFELNSQIYEPGKYDEGILHENVKIIASILNLGNSELRNTVIDTVTEGMADELKYTTKSASSFNSYLTNVIKIARRYGIAEDRTLKDKLKTVIINATITTDTDEGWNGSHSEFTSNLATLVDIIYIARQHGIADNNDFKDKVLDVIKSRELDRLWSSRHWMFGYYSYDPDYYKDNSKAFEKIKTAFALTDLEIAGAMDKAKKELKNFDDYLTNLEKKEKSIKEMKRIEEEFRACGNRRRAVFYSSAPEPMGLFQFLRTFLPL